jgi:ketosteroid isomerase-like protein
MHATQLDSEPSSTCPSILDKAHSTDRTVEDIERLERTWPEALVNADIELLEEIWADDFSLITPDGTHITRADCLAGLCDGDIRFEAFDADARQISVHGDDVVVSGRARVKCPRGLPDLNAAGCYVAIYSRREDGWRQVATVVTRTKTDTQI